MEENTNLPATQAKGGEVAAREEAKPPARQRREVATPNIALGDSPLARVAKDLEPMKETGPSLVTRGEFEAIVNGAISRKRLAAAMMIAKKVAGKRNTLPILNCVKFEKDQVVATNLDLTVRVSVPGVPELPVALPISVLQPLVQQSEDEFVHLDHTSERGVSVCGSVVVGESVEEFPKVDPPEGKIHCTINNLDPANLGRVLTSVSVDETRFNMNAVRVEACLNRLVSTDGHRLGIVDHCFTADRHDDWTLSADMVRPLVASAKPLKDLGGEVSYDMLYFKELKQVLASTGPATFYGKLQEGEFPSYSTVIPKDDTLGPRFVAEKAAWKSALKRVQPILSKKGTKGVLLTATPTGMELFVKDPDAGEARSVVEGAWHGGARAGDQVGLNARYLLDAIVDCPDTDISMDWDKKHELPASPVRVRSGNFTLLVMPMRL